MYTMYIHICNRQCVPRERDLGDEVGAHGVVRRHDRDAVVGLLVQGSEMRFKWVSIIGIKAHQRLIV